MKRVRFVMPQKSILFLLFLGAVVRFSISEKIDRNDSIILSTNLRKDPDAFVLVNPKQVHYLERTIRRFLSKMADPIKGPIILRSTSKENGLQQSIRQMCESMRTKLMQFAEECGMTVTVQQSLQKSTNFPVSEDWFSEILLQGAYMLRDLGNMIDETNLSIHRYFRKSNVTQESKQFMRQADSFQFLGVIYDAAEFSEGLSQCLLRMSNKNKYKRSFDLNRLLLNLTKYPPEDALKIFRSNVIRVSPVPLNNRAGYKSWHSLLCFSMMSDQNIRYNECVQDLQHLDMCLRTLKRRSNSETRSQEVKSWTRSIQRLSDCKIQADNRGKLQVFCKTNRKIPRKMKPRIKYMFEKILGRRIAKKSALNRAANDLGDTLSKSKWGRRFIDELSQYFAIYEDGINKLQSVSKMRDERVTPRHREVSQALLDYRRGIFLRTFEAMRKMHKSATSMEKFLVEGIKMTLNETWQSHLRILSCLMNWMTKLLEFYSGGDASENGPPSSDTNSESVPEWDEVESTNSEEIFPEDIENALVSRSRTDVMREAEASMTDLMKSMNRVARHRSANEKSMLSCLANNLLLITMFMETISFVSALFCSGQTVKDDSNSLDVEDEWDRRRRSLTLFDYSDDFQSISQDYMLLEIQENITAWIPGTSD